MRIDAVKCARCEKDFVLGHKIVALYTDDSIIQPLHVFCAQELKTELGEPEVVGVVIHDRHAKKMARKQSALDLQKL